MNILLTLLFLFTLYAISEGREDGIDTDINHKRGLWPRIFVGCIIVVLYEGLWPIKWIHPFLALLLAAWFWLIFELTYNKTAGDKWLYIGETADLDKWLRNHKITPTKLLLIKLGLIVIGGAGVLLLN